MALIANKENKILKKVTMFAMSIGTTKVRVFLLNTRKDSRMLSKS